MVMDVVDRRVIAIVVALHSFFLSSFFVVRSALRHACASHSRMSRTRQNDLPSLQHQTPSGINTSLPSILTPPPTHPRTHPSPLP